MKKNNYAYMTLLSSNSYVQGVFLLKAGLDKTESKYPLICLVTKDISEENKQNLKLFGVQVREIDTIETPENIYQHNLKVNQRQANIWKNVLTKFQVWTYTEFDKIILLDCDIMIMKNLDDCFEREHMTAALDGELFNLWPTWPHFNSGFLVLKPNLAEYNKILDFIKTFDPDNVVGADGLPYVIADQELLNIYQKDWINKENLHLNKWYNVFPPHATKQQEQMILDNAYFIHFVGIKPWQITNDEVSPLLSTELDSIRGHKVYAIAEAIIKLIYLNNFNYIDWNTQYSKLNVFNFTAGTLRDQFLEFSESTALFETIKNSFDIDDELLNNINEQIAYNNRLLQNKKHIELLLPILREIYSDMCISTKPSLNLYSITAILEKHAKLQDYNLVEDVWDKLVEVLCK